MATKNTSLETHRRALAGLRRRPAHRRDVKWSEEMVRHLKAIENATGRWESY